jgi:polysaccharide biosynthesis protein PslG
VTRRSTTLLTLVGVLSVLLAAAAASDAARRKAPFGFFGAVVDGPAAALPDLERAGQLRLMARSGVESIRRTFSWVQIEPAPGAFQWESSDQVVRSAAIHGLELLPVVIYSPEWASSRPPDGARPFWLYGPRDPQTYADFLGRLVARYGPKGEFWRLNPDLPRRPVRQWQIWNEPSADYFWATPNYRRSYVRLLKFAYRAVHHADRGAAVVMGGLTSFLQQSGRRTTSWQDLRGFYRNGARRYFDAVALHPFSLRLDGVIKTIEFNRRVMRRYRDARKPVYLTEMTWPAARGRLTSSELLGFEVTAGQQRRLLAAAYRRLLRERKLRVRRAYWYSWATTYDANANFEGRPSFEFSGLVKATPGGLGATYTRTRALSAYANVARRYEGCRKSDSARRCRR